MSVCVSVYYLLSDVYENPSIVDICKFDSGLKKTDQNLPEPQILDFGFYFIFTNRKNCAFL